MAHAIHVDSVYQRVLALANKEQRGYITPLEFNLLANQAQLDIFEKYFYDLDQAKRRDSDTTTFSDMEELIKNKLKPFTSMQIMPTPAITSGSQLSIGGNFPDNYRIGRIFVRMGDPVHDTYVVKKVEINDVLNLRNSKFHNIGLQRNPVYTESAHASNYDVEIFIGGLPPHANGVTCEVINKPNKVEWGYDVIAEKALYNASKSVNFQLHASEETNLVTRILELAGVIIQDPGVIQYADQEGTKKIQLEKA
jgi:hypothetical protein